MKPETSFGLGQVVAISGGLFDGFIGKTFDLRDRDLLFLDFLNRQTKVCVDAKTLRSA